MKKTLYIFFLLLLMFLTSCETIDANSIQLPDLSGKSRSEISTILDEYEISYSFDFSDKIIYSEEMLDKFVSYEVTIKQEIIFLRINIYELLQLYSL